MHYITSNSSFRDRLPGPRAKHNITFLSAVLGSEAGHGVKDLSLVCNKQPQILDPGTIKTSIR